MKAITFITALLLTCGCQPGSGEFIEITEPDPEPPTQDVGLTEIQQTIFSPICAQCHIGDQAPLGLRLDSVEQSFENLVGVSAVGNNSFNRVEPFEPDVSFLMLKILGDPVAGQRMPLGMTPLSDDQIDLIRSWIQQGALPVDSNNLVSIVQSKLIDNGQSTISIELGFNGNIDIALLNYESLPVYQNLDGYWSLLTQADYQIHVVSARQIQININKSSLSSSTPSSSTLSSSTISSSTIKLKVGDQNPLPLIDSNGNLIDANNNGVNGGNYETDFTWN